MGRPADTILRWVAASIGTLLLAGCATARLSQELVSPDVQEAYLRDLSAFGLEGRASARAGEEGSSPVSLSWAQKGAQSRLRLSGPVGAGGLTLEFSPGALLVSSSKGDVFRDAEAEQVLAGSLGFVPPFQALRFWVLGLAAPGEAPAEVQTDESGRISRMVQQGWLISYERWSVVPAVVGQVRLPKLLTATRADLRLRLVVDRWKLPADN